MVHVKTLSQSEHQVTITHVKKEYYQHPKASLMSFQSLHTWRIFHWAYVFFSLAAIFLQHTRDINLSSPDFIFFFFFSVEQATAILLLLWSCYLFFSLLAMLKFLFFFPQVLYSEGTRCGFLFIYFFLEFM